MLLRTPILSVNQAYSIVFQEESQRKLGIIDVNQDSLSLLVVRREGREGNFKSRKTVNGGTIPGTVCEH